ncbi:MAG: hypothetical protein KHX03_05085 [Clostridium sp.]|nr:hypothetical protein [Clostridium sp.]
MKKIISIFLLLSLFSIHFSSAYALDDELPELPTLPSLEIYTDGPIDAFSPSETPAQIAPKKPQQTTGQASSSNTSKPVVKPSTKPASKPPTKSSKTPAKNPSKSVVNNTKNSYYKNNLKNSYVVPKGKKFKVRLAQSISSNTPEGTRISFKSVYPETSRYITIPTGTIFKGRITDSHPPYITGNGGLIVINVDQMIYNGRAYEIDAKVSVANGKRIFFNNIKGKRMYFQSIPKAMRPGTKFFKKMWRVTCNLAKNESGVEIILTPFSLITGTLVYAVNLVASPVLAIFYKGKSITIPADSQFTIQLREDVHILK